MGQLGSARGAVTTYELAKEAWKDMYIIPWDELTLADLLCLANGKQLSYRSNFVTTLLSSIASSDKRGILFEKQREVFQVRISF